MSAKQLPRSQHQNTLGEQLVPSSPSDQQTIGGPETKLHCSNMEFIPSISHPRYHPCNCDQLWSLLLQVTNKPHLINSLIFFHNSHSHSAPEHEPRWTIVSVCLQSLYPEYNLLQGRIVIGYL